MATPLSAAILACATVAAGTVKSITTLAAPMAAARVGHDLHAFGAHAGDLAGVAAERVAGWRLRWRRPGAALVCSICRISIWPMRPAAPAMAIFISFPRDWSR